MKGAKLMKKKSLLIGVMTLLIVIGIGSSNIKLVYAYTNATAMYVGPVNEKKSDIMTVDWSTTKMHLILIGLFIIGMPVEKLEDMLVFNKELTDVHYTLQFGTQSL